MKFYSKIYCIVLIGMIFYSGSLFANDTGLDSTVVFTYKRYMEMVERFHPLVKQAALYVEKGDAYLLKSRGNFDPKLSTDIDQKQFNNSEYYSFLKTGLKVPTWYGVEFNGGYEQNRGQYLNPENVLPSGGLIYAGVSINVGQGLWIDERRAVLKQAKIYLESTAAEQQKMLNDILLQAGKSYWEWFTAYNSLLVYESAYGVAYERLQGVKQTAIFGDRPDIDTLEAGIQVQERQLSLQQARLDFKNKSLMLSSFLWDEEENPLELSSVLVPETYTEISVDNELLNTLFNKPDSLIDAHPELRLYAFQLDNLAIEKSWKREQLKPVLKLNYNPILNPVSSGLPSYSANNYKWGLGFSMPIFLRKERGDLALTELKIREVGLGMKNKNLELYNTILAYLNEYNTTNQQVQLYSKTVDDYEALLNAEKQIFDGGESSLFLINARELSYISAKLKLMDLIAKNQKALLAAAHAAGILGIK